MVIFDENQAVSDINKYEFINTIYVQIVNFLVIWHIWGKGTHIYSNQKHPDFHQKSPWTPMSQLSLVCIVSLVQLNTYAEIIHCGNVSQQRKEGKQLDQS